MDIIDSLVGTRGIAFDELWADREIRFDVSKKELELRTGESIIEVIVSVRKEDLCSQ
jgi:hypothetical protein